MLYMLAVLIQELLQTGHNITIDELDTSHTPMIKDSQATMWLAIVFGLATCAAVGYCAYHSYNSRTQEQLVITRTITLNNNKVTQ